jgi:hypothetical protein
MGRKQEGDDCSAELLCYLVLGAAARNGDQSLMVAKHVRSAVLSILLLKSRQDGEVSQRMRLVLKQLFPHFIRDYLLDSENQFRNAPLDSNPLQTLLAELPELPGELVALFANNWPSDAAELVTEQAVRGIIDGMPADLTVVLTRLHNRLTWARNTRKELHRKKDDGLIEREDEQLLWRCDDYTDISSFPTCHRNGGGMSRSEARWQSFLP